MTTLEITITLLGGLVAGIVNTFAGNGSIITLGILIDLLGLSGNLANGTNRLGIIAQSATSVTVFGKSGRLNLSRDRIIIVWTLLGALVGILLATQIDSSDFVIVYRILLVFMLITLIFKPARWIEPDSVQTKTPVIVLCLAYFAVGVYGGFIQMGMGVVFLAVCVLIQKYDFISANVAKVTVVALYTVVALSVFIWLDMVAWLPGILLALGQMVGAYLSARFLSESAIAKQVAYWILVLVVIVGISKSVYLWIN